MLRHYSIAVQSLSRLLSQRANPNFVALRNAADMPKSSTSENPDDPINFFGSQAESWRARQTRSGGAEEALWFQPYVISASLTIFLLYFCVLREESDIDRKLEGNLFEHVNGLEEVQLMVNYKYYKDNGLDTTQLEKRLSELGIDIKQINGTQLNK
ncbi:uncharacterized protein [Eurosta solidaginis]|uniref:uncharacterized protein n=1 Tax=Eurosta solidaginis TaxID=178769 RepID=UPI003530BE1E